MKVNKIVLAGGPACGKSGAMRRLKSFPVNPSSHVVFVNEVASGFMDWPEYVRQNDDPIVRQYYILKTQVMLEELAYEEAVKSGKERALIVCDRGVLDAFVYLTNEEISKIVTTEEAATLALRYDGVLIFEETGEEHFLSRNNSARIERDYDEVREISKRTADVWKNMAYCPTAFVHPAETMEEKTLDTALKINSLFGFEYFLLEG